MERLLILLVSFLMLGCVLNTIGCRDGGGATPTATFTPTPSPTPALLPIGTVTLIEASGPRTLPVFAESAVIGELLKSSEEFAIYYEKAMAQIQQPVYWAHDPHLPEGLAAQNGRGDNGEPVVFLREVPASANDVALIAHELQAFVLDTEGFKRASCKDLRFSDLCRSLSNVAYTPLGDSRLTAYGFNLREWYEEQTEDHIRTLSGLSEPEGLERLLWIFNYVSIVLSWEDVLGETQCKFQRWFDEHYPELGEEGRSLLTLVRSVGYSTPDRQIALFQEIIERYELEDILSV